MSLEISTFFTKKGIVYNTEGTGYIYSSDSGKVLIKDKDSKSLNSKPKNDDLKTDNSDNSENLTDNSINSNSGSVKDKSNKLHNHLKQYQIYTTTKKKLYSFSPSKKLLETLSPTLKNIRYSQPVKLFAENAESVADTALSYVDNMFSDLKKNNSLSSSEGDTKTESSSLDSEQESEESNRSIKNEAEHSSSKERLDSKEVIQDDSSNLISDKTQKKIDSIFSVFNDNIDSFLFNQTKTKKSNSKTTNEITNKLKIITQVLLNLKDNDNESFTSHEKIQEIEDSEDNKKKIKKDHDLNNEKNNDKNKVSKQKGEIEKIDELNEKKKQLKSKKKVNIPTKSNKESHKILKEKDLNSNHSKPESNLSREKTFTINLFDEPTNCYNKNESSYCNPIKKDNFKDFKKTEFNDSTLKKKSTITSSNFFKKKKTKISQKSPYEDEKIKKIIRDNLSNIDND